MRVQELVDFIDKRHAIYTAKSQGKPYPFRVKIDEILQTYRFCNVYRELDTQTKWLADNWRTPNSEDPDFWFAALVFRLTNWHETAEELGYPVPWNRDNFIWTIRSRKGLKKKVYNGAYMISTHGRKMPKEEYLADMLDAIWEARGELRFTRHDTLASFHKRLENAYGVGSFIAAQVIADAKYVGEMYKARDWGSFAASGPGSRRGLNRVMDMPVEYPKDEASWRMDLTNLLSDVNHKIGKLGMHGLHAQDLQNCLCEFDKYERVRLGEGRPKSRYKGESE